MIMYYGMRAAPSDLLLGARLAASGLRGGTDLVRPGVAILCEVCGRTVDALRVVSIRLHDAHLVVHALRVVVMRAAIAAVLNLAGVLGMRQEAL